MIGHFNSFSSRGGGFEQKVSKNSNAQGVALGGMLKLLFDWYITMTIQLLNSTVKLASESSAILFVLPREKLKTTNARPTSLRMGFRGVFEVKHFSFFSWKI